MGRGGTRFAARRARWGVCSPASNPSSRLERDAKLEDDLRALEDAARERTREVEEARAFTELLFRR